MHMYLTQKMIYCSLLGKYMIFRQIYGMRN